VLQRVAVCCSVSGEMDDRDMNLLQCFAVCCSVLQRVAVWCMLQFVAVCCSGLQWVAASCSICHIMT